MVTTGTNTCSIIVDRRWISYGASASAVWEQNCGGLATLKIIVILLFLIGTLCIIRFGNTQEAWSGIKLRDRLAAKLKCVLDA